MHQESIRLNEMSNEHVYDFLEGSKGDNFAKEVRSNNQSLRRLMRICLVVVIVSSLLFGIALAVTIVTFKQEDAANIRQMEGRFNSLENVVNRTLVDRGKLDGCTQPPNFKDVKTCVCESIDGRTSIQYTSMTKQYNETFNHCPVSFCLAGEGTWSLFDVTRSVIECYTTTSSGAGYKGQNTCTVTGRICQRWNTDYPQKRSQVHIPKNYQDLNSNYCRDPGPPYGYKPWCYTTDPNVRWEYCHVPLC